MTLPNMDPGREKNLMAAVRYLFETFKIEYTKENAEHLLVLLEAVKIHDDRNAQYGDLWVDSGARVNFYDAARKAYRAKRIAEKDNAIDSSEGLIDDALDIINYVTFGIRNARAFNFDEKED